MTKIIHVLTFVFHRYSTTVKEIVTRGSVHQGKVIYTKEKLI